MKKRRQQQHPPYLDGRVASNSVSTRRSMRTSAGRFMQFFLCVMMLMAFSVQKASAYDDWQDSWISQWYDAENATIVLDIRVYQSWGGAGSGHCGFCRDDGWLDVSVAGYDIHLKGPKDQWTSYDPNSDQVTGIDKKYVQWLGFRKTNGDKGSYFIKITIPLIQDRIGKDVFVKYKGVWWRELKTATDQDVDFTATVDTHFGCTPTIITNAYYGVKGNKAESLFSFAV